MSTNNTKQAGWIAIGSFCSFVVAIVSPMILSRFFDKADYGTYKQVMYVYSTLLTVFTLGLPRAYAYFIPKVPIEQAKSVINKITWIFFVLGTVFSVVLFIGATSIAEILKNPDLATAIKWFSPVPLLLLPTMGIDGIYAAFRRTKDVAIYTIATRIITVLFTVLPVVLFDGNYVHAIMGFTIASLLSCIAALYMKTLPVQSAIHEDTDVTYRNIFAFSLPLLYASIWGTIFGSANQFFISRYYGNEVFAEYSNGFMELPFVGMIIGSVGTILLPLFSKMDKGGRIDQAAVSLWQSTLEKSARIIFPMSLCSIFLSSLLMICMYGDMYASSDIYFLIRNIGGLPYVIPCAPVMIALGRVKEYARIHLYVAIAIVVIEYICVKTIDSSISIAVTYVLLEWVKIAYIMHVIASSLSLSVSRLLPKRQLCKVFMLSTIAGSISLLSTSFFEINKFILLTIGIVVFLSSYYILCRIFKITYRDIALSFAPKISNSPLIKIIP